MCMHKNKTEQRPVSVDRLRTPVERDNVLVQRDMSHMKLGALFESARGIVGDLDQSVTYNLRNRVDGGSTIFTTNICMP